MLFSNFYWIIILIIYIFSIKRIFFTKNFMIFQNLLPKTYFQNFLFFLGLSWLFLAAAIFVSRPYFPIYEYKNSFQIVLALDSSISMKTQDIYPSRIEVVKKWMQNFLSKNPSIDIWVVVFAGKAYISLPVSNQIEIVKNYISSLKVFDISNQNLQWTAIGDAILFATKMFSQKQKAIVVISDGQSNKWIGQKLAYEYAVWSWIDVYMIGVWSKQGWYLTIWSWVQKIDWVDLKDFEWKKYQAQDIKEFENALENIVSWYKNEKILFWEKKYIDWKNIIFFSSLILLILHFLTQSKFSED